ncbi:hypothetical protein Fmac_015507 [Flemingia macrophylla]|uniref:Uncharacterized protein n=1 Tax=Flemingia macrophylla TaxID=520843 RepID=A0ABD1MEW9_9FABA
MLLIFSTFDNCLFGISDLINGYNSKSFDEEDLDCGDEDLHYHGGKDEEEDNDKDYNIETSLELAEGEESEDEALASEAIMEVRSVVGEVQQLVIEGGTTAIVWRVVVVARVPLQGESTSD